MLTLTDAQLDRIKKSTGVTGNHTRATCEVSAAERTPAEENFLRHIQRYKHTGQKRLYPSWQEIMALLKALGWQEPPLDTAAQ